MAKIKTDKKTGKVKLNKTQKEIKKTPKTKVKQSNIKLILDAPKTEVKKTKINVDLSQVNVAINALFKLTKETVSKKLFDDEYPIFLQVNCIKIPNCADRILRLPLKNSLLTDTSEVCLIVPDLKKGRRVDYNPTIEHFEDLLRENEITNIKRILPMNAIKTEYDQYELKRRLAGQYDLFLADGRICGHLSHLLGKAFYTKRKLPTPIHTKRPDLKKSIDKALKKTQLHIHSKGGSWLTQIGHSKMTVEQITDNLESVCEELARVLPGGWNNIRSLHVKTHLSIAIPVYMTLKSVNEVKTPKVKSKRPKMDKKETDLLSTLNDEEITVLPSGNVLVTKFEKKKQLMLNK